MPELARSFTPPAPEEAAAHWQRQARLRTNDDSYAGDLTVEEAWQFLQEHPAAQLIDVRTPPEWAFAGVPDLTGLNKSLLRSSWRLFPTMQINEAFVPLLKRELPEDAPLLFLCRTGGRSREAAQAATAAGHALAFNLQDGFDGPLNAQGQRGTVSGWRAAGLPWRQE